MAVKKTASMRMGGLNPPPSGYATGWWYAYAVHRIATSPFNKVLTTKPNRTRISKPLFDSHRYFWPTSKWSGPSHAWRCVPSARPGPTWRGWRGRPSGCSSCWFPPLLDHDDWPELGPRWRDAAAAETPRRTAEKETDFDGRPYSSPVHYLGARGTMAAWSPCIQVATKLVSK